MIRESPRRWRVLQACLFAAGSATGALFAQVLPPAERPPVERRAPRWEEKPKPRSDSPSQAPSASGVANGSIAPATAPTVSMADLLLTCDVPCLVWIDENQVARIDESQIKNGLPSRISATAGQHLLLVRGIAGEGPLQEPIDIKPPQTAKVISLRGTSSVNFDRAMAELWLASCDLKFAGIYVESLPAKVFSKSHETDFTILFVSHRTFRTRAAAVSKLRPSDPSRQRMSDEMEELLKSADHFVEELQKAIEEGREEKGFLSRIFSRGGSAVALDDALEWSSDFWQVLAASQEFISALPERRRDQVQGRGRCEGAPGRLGVEVFNERPATLALVRAGGMAHRAGLKLGDEILKADGRTITEIEQLEQMLAQRPGRPIELTVQNASTGTPRRVALSGKSQ